MCKQDRLRPACTSVQADQSVACLHEQYMDPAKSTQ